MHFTQNLNEQYILITLKVAGYALDYAVAVEIRQIGALVPNGSLLPVDMAASIAYSASHSNRIEPHKTTDRALDYWNARQSQASPTALPSVNYSQI